MRTREIETARKFGILERCRAFEKDLLAIGDVVPDKQIRISKKSFDEWLDTV